MLSDSIKSLILEEQARQLNLFVEGVDMDAYLVKLGEQAEILSDSVAGRCRGFVAYYCNDLATRQAYIALMAVDPRDRGVGLGGSLVACVLNIARQRGFTSCRLEVRKSNQAAQEMYLAQGFRVIEDRTSKYLSEIVL
jgi:ribosomal protein S18 acetylase RimI-like enzyme